MLLLKKKICHVNVETFLDFVVERAGKLSSNEITLTLS